MGEISTFEKNILEVLNDSASPMKQKEIRNALIKIENERSIYSEILGKNIFEQVQEKRRRRKQITLGNINIAVNNLENKSFILSSNNEGGARIYTTTDKGKKI